MNRKRWIGVALFIAGLILVFVGNYINTRVDEGQDQVESGQEQIDRSTQLFSLTPFTDWIGRSFSSGDQSEVNRGRAEVSHYAKVASRFHTGGIIVSIIGIGIVGLSFRKKQGF